MLRAPTDKQITLSDCEIATLQVDCSLIFGSVFRASTRRPAIVMSRPRPLNAVERSTGVMLGR